MRTTDPLAEFGTKVTPQTQQVPGRTDQVKNNAGGYVFEVSFMTQLRRFLTIGSAGGTYYVGQDALTRENGQMIIDAITAPTLASNRLQHHKALVDEIVEISLGGRAMKQNPTLFALAIACQIGETEGKQYARKQITKVVRTGTHLFLFAGYLQQFGGWSRGIRRELGKWYSEKEADQLAYQLVKYRQREGWTHKDLIRLTHPKVASPRARASIDWVLNGTDPGGPNPEGVTVPNPIRGFQAAQEGFDPVGVLDKINLPWEALPDAALNNPEVWKKLIGRGMPLGALLRQLPRLTRLGLISDLDKTSYTDLIVMELRNSEAITRSRIHPFNVLVAMKTYASGQGKGSTWTPSHKIVDALDDMFYLAFGNVTPTGKRTMNALDLSASMTWPENFNQRLKMDARQIAAALSMVTVRTEPNMMTVGFTSSGGYFGSGLSVLPISSRQRLDDVMATIQQQRAGATDCSLPMLYAMENNLPIDTFVIYTDNETHSGSMHPFQALKQYRKASGIDSKLIVVACTPTRFSIADPNDPGMLDISGFDSATPQLISDFSAGLV